ncbi:MAG TPA: sugar ABC transporter substrate-binding protein [Firmicutes bacterium]|nr:sugar ABC transporter substrate-binding protein [Bacillota bacterium]
MSKRILCLGLLSLVVIAMFSSSISMVLAAGKAVEIEWYAWGRPAEVEFFHQAIAEFEKKNPGIRIKLTETGWDEHHRTLDVRIAGGNAPDIYRTTFPYVGRYIKAKQALDLSPHLLKEYRKRFWPNLRQFVESDGKFYGVPQMTDTHVVFYNIDYFKAAGIEAPATIDKAWTWEDWENIGRKLKSKSPAKYGFAGALYNGEPWYINTWGGGFVTPDGKKPDVNKPEVIKGLKLQKKWYDEGLEPINTLFLKPDSHEQLFALGQIGVIFSGTWMAEWLKDQIGDKFKWGTTFVPKGPAGFSTALGGCLNVISPQSKHPKEAAKFLEWLNTDEVMERFCQLGFIPTSVPLAKRISYKDPTINGVMKAALQQYAQIPPIVVTQYKQKNYAGMVQVFIETIGPAMHGQITVEQAVKMLDKELRRLID